MCGKKLFSINYHLLSQSECPTDKMGLDGFIATVDGVVSEHTWMNQPIKTLEKVKFHEDSLYLNKNTESGILF